MSCRRMQHEKKKKKKKKKKQKGKIELSKFVFSSIFMQNAVSKLPRERLVTAYFIGTVWSS